MAAEEMDTEISIDLGRLDPEGETIEGEADIIDLDEEFVKPFGGVRYRLHAQLVGDELLVTGHLEQDFDLVCSRCGKDFDTTIVVDDFTESYPVDEKSREIVLTSDARDSIILNLPSYPVCEESCPGIAADVRQPVDGRWAALDGLITKKGNENG